ncbi:MAG: lactate racemase domain-containing protein [Negativicutes bacterium]|nr:lactate racemase domain-containing protein [Negativicutes bacterium]
MDIIQELIKNVPLPRIVKVKQHFPATEVTNVAQAVKEQLAKPGVGDTVRPGMRIAVTVGSRGISKIDQIAAAVVAELKSRGAEPFVVPAMGSHGGASAAGQIEVLAGLGVTEESLGCPIRSSMEVVELGHLDNGLSVLIDRNAYEADGIVILNRVKPHTAFRGTSESGLVKMITIGLGKQKGADFCHAYGFGHMAKHILAMSAITLAKTKILFGVGLVENAYDKPMKIVGVPAAEIVAEDAKLLVEAKENMPRILFDPMDVLLVNRMGKEFSGSGMDPNITSRYPTPFATGGPKVEKLVVFDLTDETHGNANGIGMADFTTRRLVSRINYAAMYANAFTSTVLAPVRVPATMETERDAILAAIKTCNARDIAQVRLVRIQDTLHLGEIWISEALLSEAKANPAITVSGEPEMMRFDDEGRLSN